MMKFFTKCTALLVVLLAGNMFAQMYKGPAKGSVASGVIVTTETAAPEMPETNPGPRPPKNKIPYSFLGATPDLNVMPPAFQTEFQTDPALRLNKTMGFDSSLTIANFDGIADAGTNIPPDPYIAVGPEHIITTINTSFRISDKAGKSIKTYNANTWFKSVFPEIGNGDDAGAFDPKVIYDQFDKRWVMVWLDVDETKKTSSFLISVSDDSTATGTWYNYMLPSNTNGDLDAGNWGDYQGVGYDEKGLYLTTNQFAFGGSFQYPKIRFIDKKELYANTAGPLSWTDIWGVREATGGEMVFGIRPSRIYGHSDDFYFLSVSPYRPGTYMVLHKLSDPFGTPVLTSSKISVTSYSNGSNANQKGGGTPLVEAGSSNLRNEPILRNGKLHSVFAVKSGTVSSLRYLVMNPVNDQLLDDKTFGASGYWHFYPALAVDKNENVILTYSRSSANEYIGAFYVAKKSYSSTFEASKPVALGLGNYVKTFGSDRNRWGDYNGAWVDPADENNIWLYTEYAAGTNLWGARVHGLRLTPFEKAFAEVSEKTLAFGTLEAGDSSEVKSFIITNKGKEKLVITNIASPFNTIKLSGFKLPAELGLYDSLAVSAQFIPEKDQSIDDAIVITSNHSGLAELAINVTAKGFFVRPALADTFYAVTGVRSKVQLIRFDPATAASKAIGPTGFADMQSLSVNPVNGEIFGLYSGASFSTIGRVSSLSGVGYPALTVPAVLKAASFGEEHLYGVSADNRIYDINELTGDTTFIAVSKIPVQSMAYNPVNDEFWASVPSTFAAGKDRIYKLDIMTGDTVFVGQTGLAVMTNALTFDKDGKLYGVTGGTTQVASLISISTKDAKATVLGSMGFTGVKGIAVLNHKAIVEVADGTKNIRPDKFQLMQNYPNPFNPSTQISYYLPMASKVSLKVYDIIGHEITELVSGDQTAGLHTVSFSAQNLGLSSGVYLYKLTAGSFTQTRKMLLVK